MSAARAAQAFRAAHAAACDGVWAAPGRVNLIGEYTDVNEGFVMPFALPHRTWVAARARTDGRLRLHSAAAPGDVAEVRPDDLVPGAVRGWAAYPAGVLWALREAGHDVPGADLHVESDVPVGAGLSSSAALEVATALALDGLCGAGLSRPALARLAQRAENAFVGVPCGVMDQTASACCRDGHVLHLDTRDLSRRHVPFDPAAHGLCLLVVDTRVRHDVGAGAYARRRAGCEKAAHALGVRALRDVAQGQWPAALQELAAAPGTAGLLGLVRHVVTENQRVEEVTALLEAGEARATGALLTAGHASLRDDFGVSCPELDLVVAAATGAGALGARMTGAGFGGSAVVLAEAAAEETVRTAVAGAFAAAGHRAPRIVAVAPAQGAGRVA
ncbi:galactokinase [Streptomyces sp. SCA3-4]|uniref:galactokinase n=1 Tax=Streptomyces sichuanensis TaxID=2871810 RepID=UPI001CE34ADB|nr:galactokinase [Streptomyces sichuanensis]MCA6096217.1 galactokinase [Streptomyces sichuanensis]MCA6096227.1 galactokinase [Streptomyces sichuanensis]